MTNAKNDPAAIAAPKNIAVVGAGITGLAAAHQLVNNVNIGVHVTLIESGNRLGGVLRTEYNRGFLIEASADMFVTESTSAIGLIHKVGIGEQLISPIKTNRFSSIVRKGKLIRIPQGFSLLAPNKILPVLKSPLLSAHGKLRFLYEWFTRAKKRTADESVKSFAVRHYGNEVFQRIIQPLVAGIYSADASELSIQATLKRFVEMAERHGSLIKASRIENRSKTTEQQSSGARYGLFVTPQNGMQSLVDAVAADMPDVDVRLGTPVLSVVSDGKSWVVKTRNDSQSFDTVLIATSATSATKLLGGRLDSLRSILSDISMGSMIVVTIACDKSCFKDGPPNGFGFVVPEIENRGILACSYSSNKFQGRAPEGKFLMRCFIGGPNVDQSLAMTDIQLEAIVIGELRELIGFQSDSKIDIRVFRWLGCMPQYLVGHLEKMKQLDQQLENHAGLELTGNSYLGVGIPACIQSGQHAANRILNQIDARG